jgi:hypothetical protein
VDKRGNSGELTVFRPGSQLIPLQRSQTSSLSHLVQLRPESEPQLRLFRQLHH